MKVVNASCNQLLMKWSKLWVLHIFILGFYLCPTAEASDLRLLAQVLGLSERSDFELVANSPILYASDSIGGRLLQLRLTNTNEQVLLEQTYHVGEGPLANVGRLGEMAISLDGRYLYVTGEPSPLNQGRSLNTLLVDRESGELLLEGSLNFAATSRVLDIQVAPDGLDIYAIGGFDLVNFRRSPSTGVIEMGTRYDTSPGGEFEELRSAGNLFFSPDGNNLYSTFEAGSVLVTLSRNIDTGELGIQDRLRGGALGPLNGIREASSLTVSPDGRDLYVASKGDQAITRFNRDLSDGSLSFREIYFNEVEGNDALVRPSGIAVNPAGTRVYVGNQSNQLSLAKFSRITNGFMGDFGLLRSSELIEQADSNVFNNSDALVKVSGDNGRVFVLRGDAGALSILGEPPPILFEAISPNWRSIPVGEIATGFGLILGDGGTSAKDCILEVSPELPIEFNYWKYDSTNESSIGDANSVFDVPLGGTYEFLYAISSETIIDRTEISVSPSCSNGAIHAPISGITTLNFSAETESVPDVVAVVAGGNDLGVLEFVDQEGATASSRQSVGAFALAAINLGGEGQVRFLPNGSDFPVLPDTLSLSICETTTSGECVAEPAEFVDITLGNSESITASVFVTIEGVQRVLLEPSASRIGVDMSNSVGELISRVSIAATVTPTFGLLAQ